MLAAGSSDDDYDMVMIRVLIDWLFIIHFKKGEGGGSFITVVVNKEMHFFFKFCVQQKYKHSNALCTKLG